MTDTYQPRHAAQVPLIKPLCSAVGMMDGDRTGLICVRSADHGERRHNDPVYGEWVLTLIPHPAVTP